MTKQNNATYKGYNIATHSSGSNTPPYKASFSVVQVSSDKTKLKPEIHFCDGAYKSEDEAHEAANVAARKFIDSQPSRK